MKAAAVREAAAGKAEAPAKPRQAVDGAVQPVNPTWQALALRAQTKLAVGSPDDPAEHEADRVADRVMRMPDRLAGDQKLPSPSFSSRAVAVQRKCKACKEEDEGGALVQRELASPGRPLDAASRGFFEPRFGADFGAVRVHADSGADASARQINARAYTYGNDVVFGEGQFDPSSSRGRQLLAHELTHVLQQRGGSAPLGISRAPLAISRGIAGNCIGNQDNCTLGTNIHRFIQGRMVSLYSPAMFAEVAIPGGGMGTSCKLPGYVDLYGTLPIGIVPAVPQGRMFPPPFASFPTPAPVPGTAMLGSIKPFTTPPPLAYADLASYITAFDAFVALSGSPLSIASPMRVPTPLNWAVPGIPFPFSPATLPQMMHVFPTFDGMYWYFCRPLIELAWLAREAARMISEMMDKLKEAAERLGQQVVYAFEAVLAGLAAAMRAIDEFLEEWGTVILAIIALIVVVVIVVFCWEIIVAAAAAAAVAAGAAAAEVGAAVAAFFAEAATGLAALEGLGALLLLLLPSEAGAAEPPVPAGPGTPAGGPSVSGGQSAGAPSRAALQQLLERLQSQGSMSQSPQDAIPQMLRIIDEAEGAVRPVTGGDLLVYVLELLRHLLQQELLQQSLPSPVPPPRASRGSASPPSGGAVPRSGGTAPPSGGTAPPSGGTAPPSRGTAPPSRGTAPPSGGTAPPSGAGGGGRTLGSGGGAAGGGAAATPVNAWPIIYEEIGSTRHFMILPAGSVANGTSSILLPGNSGAILRVVNGRELQNTTQGNRVVAIVEASNLLPAGFRLVSGELASLLDEDFSQWRRRNRRPMLEDLVTPQLHFR